MYHLDNRYAHRKTPTVTGSPTGKLLQLQVLHRYSSGVDLNCGCPQTWAKKEGLGACLIKKPQLVKEMVKETRER